MSSEFTILSYNPDFESKWDELVSSSHNGTALHSRAFLGYHDLNGARFDDCSTVVHETASNYIRAVFSAARDPNESGIVTSHPGSTFGGLVTRTPGPVKHYGYWLKLAEHYLDQGFHSLRVRLTPSMFHRQPDDTDLRLFARVGTYRRTDLWSAINLAEPHTAASKRRSSIKAARKKGITTRLADSETDWYEFYQLLSENLADRHQAAPVHSFDELLMLATRLKGANKLLVAEHDDQIVAGTWLLNYTPSVIHTQYIASSDHGRRSGAVDVLLHDAIELSKAEAARVFSFGISTEQDGETINNDLLAYKTRFAAGATCQFHMESKLEALRSELLRYT